MKAPVLLYLALFALATMLILTVGDIIYFDFFVCHDQCQQGSKFCQERCFKNGHCPFAGQE